MTTPQKRKQATDFIVASIRDMLPQGANADRIQKELDSLSDEDFGKYMKAISKGTDGEDCIKVYVPNFSEEQPNLERNYALAKKLGHDFFQQLVMGSDDPDSPDILTPNRYMVLKCTGRRQAQLLIEGISVSEHHQTIDQRTGAATRESAAAKVSFPELQVLAGYGMTETLRELFKGRGGDVGAFNAMNTACIRDGEVSLDSIEPYSTGVGAVRAVRDMLNSMHIANTL